MPKTMERGLRKGARKRGLKPGSKAWNRYVHGSKAMRTWRRKQARRRRKR